MRTNIKKKTQLLQKREINSQRVQRKKERPSEKKRDLQTEFHLDDFRQIDLLTSIDKVTTAQNKYFDFYNKLEYREFRVRWTCRKLN